jgi:hypothetical protein
MHARIAGRQGDDAAPGRINGTSVLVDEFGQMAAVAPAFHSLPAGMQRGCRYPAMQDERRGIRCSRIDDDNWHDGTP